MQSSPRSRILCVDDDEDACEMLSVLLSSYGIDTTCTQSAIDAWPLIKNKCFDLYLLDGWLPRTDGFEFCRQIREFDSKTPIVFYSGAAYEADKQKGFAAGANAYVTKPDVDGLIKTLKRLIAEARVENTPVYDQPKSARWPSQGSFQAQWFSFEAASN